MDSTQLARHDERLKHMDDRIEKMESQIDRLDQKVDILIDSIQKMQLELAKNQGWLNGATVTAATMGALFGALSTFAMKFLPFVK